MRRVAAIFLLLCATTHCVLSIFYVNTSYLNLHDYASGRAPQPFQRRFLMVPVLRWAESNSLLQTIATRYAVNVPQLEPMTAAKLACIVFSVLLLNGFGLWTIRTSRDLTLKHWWLLWAILLVILYSSYGARYEQPLWYAYDIPHLVLFGFGTVAILSNRPLLFAFAFLLDAPLRETAIFLLPVALLVRFQSRVWRTTAVACGLYWILIRLLAYRLYPLGAHQWNGVHWYSMLKPWHLPQLFSVVGFLWLPVWIGHKYLSQQERLALYGATALMVITFYFATWNETRAWLEWTTLFATLAALQIERAFAKQSLTVQG